VQTTGLAPVHVPAWHVSVWVQALPSEQDVPFGRGDASHASVVSLQTPTLHWLPAAEQLRGVPEHVPPPHASFTVQKRPSSQGTVLFGWVQAPAPLQTSLVQRFVSAAQVELATRTGTTTSSSRR
jgi:hypothetical protein